MMRYTIFFLLAGAHASTLAVSQNWEHVRHEAELQVKKDMAGARFVFKWDKADLPNLPSCSRIHYTWPGQAKGKVFVQAKCEGPQTWQVRLPAWVSLIGNVASTTRPLPKDSVLEPEHIGWQEVELARYPEDVLTSPVEAVGKMLKLPVQGGQVLRRSYLRASYAVQRLQTVKLRARMQGFSITSEGIAQSNAAAGEIVKVKVKSGALIEGTAREGGIVEVMP